VDPTVHRAYVTNSDFFTSNVTVIDTTTNTVVGAPDMEWSCQAPDWLVRGGG
jgi:DNA-binding beta-propeller fold protein YncE